MTKCFSHTKRGAIFLLKSAHKSWNFFGKLAIWGSCAINVHLPHSFTPTNTSPTKNSNNKCLGYALFECHANLHSSCIGPLFLNGQTTWMLLWSLLRVFCNISRDFDIVHSLRNKLLLPKLIMVVQVYFQGPKSFMGVPKIKSFWALNRAQGACFQDVYKSVVPFELDPVYERIGPQYHKI